MHIIGLQSANDQNSVLRREKKFMTFDTCPIIISIYTYCPSKISKIGIDGISL